MKQWKLLLAAVCAMALLAGCGDAQKTEPKQDEPQTPPAQTDTAEPDETTPDADEPQTPDETAPDGQTEPDAGTQTPPDYTLEKLRADQTLDQVLSRHSSVTCTTEVRAEPGAEPIATMVRQYVRDGGDTTTVSTYTPAEGAASYSALYESADFFGAEYAAGEGGEKYLTIYATEEDYAQALESTWFLDGGEGTEEMVEASWQDGAIVLTTKTTYRQEAENYTITDYYIDAQTEQMLAVSRTNYAPGDDSVLGTTLTTFSFDDAAEPEVDPVQEITGGTDYCELTVVMNYGEADQQVRWYPVSHDTSVRFQATGDYTLYADEDLTQERGRFDEIDVSGAAANVFVVAGK